MPCSTSRSPRVWKLPIAVVPFATDIPEGDTLPVDMHVTIANDLARSGRFKPMNVADMPQKPDRFQDVNFSDWRLLGMENVLLGNIKKLENGNYEIQFRLVDIYRGTQIAGFRIPASKNQLRRTAHRISDIVFEKLTGIPGAFDTRIAYVTVQKQIDGSKLFALQIADADGFNPKVLLESSEPLMSPSWSPAGRKLADVSFEGKSHLCSGHHDGHTRTRRLSRWHQQRAGLLARRYAPGPDPVQGRQSGNLHIASVRQPAAAYNP